jgi:hypothetical protein
LYFATCNYTLSLFFSFYRNVGKFGGTNQPGYPRPWRIAGKFASQACAMSPLYMMNTPTTKQDKDTYTLSRLLDCITAWYYPGDLIVIAMSHPSNFCTGYQDIVRLRDWNSLALFFIFLLFFFCFIFCMY